MKPETNISPALSGATLSHGETEEKREHEIVRASRTPTSVVSAFGIAVFVEIRNVRSGV